MIYNKILHILISYSFNQDVQKINFDFIKELKLKGHEFLLLIEDNNCLNRCYNDIFIINISTISFSKISKLKKLFNEYDYIIWHGLYLSGKFYFYFFFFSRYLKKFIWISQGTDLYNWKRKNNNFRNIIYNYFGNKFRKHIRYFATTFIHDCTYWEKNINKHGRPFLVNYFNSKWFIYIDALLRKQSVEKILKKKLKILIGLGSSPVDNHLKLLNIVRKYRYENIKFILINDTLNLNSEYFIKVINYAKLMYGEKVTVLTCEKFTRKYFSILNSVDIVLSNMDSNAVHYDYQYEKILSALFLKRTVFLSSKSNLRKMLDNKKVKIYELNTVTNYTATELKKLLIKQNEENEFLENLKTNIKTNKYWNSLLKSVENSDTYLKFLHIIRPSVELSVPIMKIINENFNANEHRFLIRRRINSLFCEKFMEFNVVDLFLLGSNKIKRFLYFYKKLNNCDVIVWHGLYVGYGEPVLSLKELAFLSLFPKFLNKIAWVGWGIDLYKWRKEAFGYFSIKSVFIKFINKLSYKVRVQIPYFITIFPPDADSFKKQFGYISKAMIFDGTYSNPRFITDIEDSRPETIVKYPKRPLHIMIGHSANEYNDHFYLLDLLSKYRYENIQIYLPLSTGPNRKYAQSVEDYAKKLYGKKAVAINNKMSLKKYLEFLWNMDIVIFNIKHQAAVGNLMSLIYMCKKIYLPSDGLMYKFFNSQHVKIFDTNKIDIMNFQEFSKINIDRKPPEYVLERTDYIKNCEKWRDIFYKIYQTQKERMNEENVR